MHRWYLEPVLFYARMQGGSFSFGFELYSISSFYQFKERYYAPRSLFVVLWPTLTHQLPSGYRDCLPPAVSAASKAPLLLIWGQPLYKHRAGVSGNPTDGGSKKKVPSSLWQWTLHIKPQPVSSVTCIIMRAASLSGLEKTLYYPCVADSSRWASGCGIWTFLF